MNLLSQFSAIYLSNPISMFLKIIMLSISTLNYTFRRSTNIRGIGNHPKASKHYTSSYSNKFHDISFRPAQEPYAIPLKSYTVMFLLYCIIVKLLFWSILNLSYPQPTSPHSLATVISLILSNTEPHLFQITNRILGKFLWFCKSCAAEIPQQLSAENPILVSGFPVSDLAALRTWPEPGVPHSLYSLQLRRNTDDNPADERSWAHTK